MTAQIGENLLFRGESVTLYADPLANYFLMGGRKPDFAVIVTSLRRGYVGSWEIVDGRLYLVELRGQLMDGSAATLETVFPEHPRRVFAHWYSGTLRVPRGELLRCSHGGWGSVYERDTMLVFERGVMRHTWMRENAVAEAESPSAGAGTRRPIDLGSL